MTTATHQGFEATEGFPLVSGNTYAQLIPHKGLIPLIWIDGRPPEHSVTDAVFPEEEVVHTLSITRNPLLSYHALMEYWDWHDTVADLGATEVPARRPGRHLVVSAWRPFYEALATVYAEVVDADVMAKNTAYRVQIGRHELHVEQARSQPRTSVRAPPLDEAHDYVDVEYLLRKRVQSQMEALVTEIVNEYVEQGLLTTDLKAWARDEPWFTLDRHSHDLDAQRLKAYQLLEKFVPYELYSANLYPLEHEPADYWAAIHRVLTDWRHHLAQGDSPFPIEDMTLGGIFLAEWVRATCGTVRMLDLTVRQHPAKVVSSLPAIFHVLNPYLFDQSVLSTPTRHTTVLYPCVFLPPAQSDQYYVLWHRRRGESLAQLFFKNCQLYPDLKPWQSVDMDAADSDALSAYIRLITRQIHAFLQRLEDLWLYQRAEAECPHCQYVLKSVSKDSLLPAMLERRVFTAWQETARLESFAEMYPDWLAREITATHRLHRAFEGP